MAAWSKAFRWHECPVVILRSWVRTSDESNLGMHSPSALVGHNTTDSSEQVRDLVKIDFLKKKLGHS